MSDQAGSSAPAVRYYVTFNSRHDEVSTCEVPCAFGDDGVQVVEQVHAAYGHLAYRDGGITHYLVVEARDGAIPLAVRIDGFGRLV